MSAPAVVGILLAAGRGERFGGDKLLARLPDGECVGVAAARHLLAAVPDVIAVIRPGDAALAAALGAAGARIVRCANADEGMGASLACAVRERPEATGWIVALADMPWIQTATIALVVRAMVGETLIAAPFHRGERGHPVGFANALYPSLAALTGDEGAKAIVAAHRDSITRIDVDDAGILRDIDTPADVS